MPSTKTKDPLREHLVKVLDWHDAHATFDNAVAGIPPLLQGKQPAGLPYSPWQLIEHLRLTQFDILDFCINPKYVELEWPKDYWPENESPPSAAAWTESIAAYKKDRDQLKKLCANGKIDLFEKIPHGTGQTLLREILLVADHTAYHLGQMIAVRRQLQNWKES